MGRLFGICLLSVVISCGKSYKKIQLDQVDPVLKEHIEEVVLDFVQLVPSGKVNEFKKRGYVTPLVHMGFTSLNGIYSLAPYQLKTELGADFELELVKVLERKLVYSFSYEVKSEKVRDGNKKLMFDINKDFGLAKIYFFVKNEGDYATEKEWVNLFSNDLLMKK